MYASQKDSMYQISRGIKLYQLKSNDRFLEDALEKDEKPYILTIKDMPSEEQPREKLIKAGPGALSIHELLAVVLNTGTKKEGVWEMSSRILKEYGEQTLVGKTNAKDLARTLDIPLIKAAQIVACGELGRRFFEKKFGGLASIRTAKDVYEYLASMRNLPKEHFRGIYLNTHHQVIHDEVISIGTINSNLIHPREVFKPALEYAAAAVVLAHNHPSGVTVASAADIEITEQLIKAGKILGINVVDHVIIGHDGYSSVEADYN
jgi:DNA repair protein RadC